MNNRLNIAIGTLVQFITISILGVPHAFISIISTCQSDHSNCISNMVVSLIFFILTVIWFGFIAIIGFSTQEKRSWKIALFLIGCEFANIGVALTINLPGETNIFDKFISIVDAILSILVIYLASKVIFAKGGRIVKKNYLRKIFK